MVKICKKPYIIERSDRWGLGSGVFEVVNTVGWVPSHYWEYLRLYENYSNTPQGQKESKNTLDCILMGVSLDKIHAPILRELMQLSNGHIVWEFNMQSKKDINNDEYIRTFATFNHVTLHAWSEKHDEQVLKLTKKCKELNKKRKV